LTGKESYARIVKQAIRRVKVSKYRNIKKQEKKIKPLTCGHGGRNLAPHLTNGICKRCGKYATRV
jgi:hypothetical protein